jgi:hypothetical protein
MKKLTWMAIIFLSLGLNASAQKTLSDLANAPLVVVMAKSPVLVYPIYIEETDSSIVQIVNNDTLKIEYFKSYINRRKPIARGVRKTIVTKDKIKIWQNDTLRVDIKRQSDVQSGIISNTKGMVKQTLIPSQHPAIAPTEQYMLQGDSLNFLIFRPELNLVEVESSKNYQRRRMIGHLYGDISNSSTDTLKNIELNRSLHVNDEFQVLYSSQTLNENGLEFSLKPSRLLQFSIKRIDTSVDPTEIIYYASMTDLETSTEFEIVRNKILLHDEGFIINEMIMVRDTFQIENIKVFPLNSPVRMHPFYPGIDISGPMIEARFERPAQIGDSSFSIMSYWDSRDGARINYLPDFVFPWVDNGESIVATPVYLQIGDTKLGQKHEIPENKKLHFSKVEASSDSLILEIYSHHKLNIEIEVQDSNGKLIKKLKQSYGLRKGNTRLAMRKLGLPYGSKAEIVLLTIENGVPVEHQRFKYTEVN